MSDLSNIISFHVADDEGVKKLLSPNFSVFFRVIRLLINVKMCLIYQTLLVFTLPTMKG